MSTDAASEKNEPNYLVVVGASAGGIEALSILLESLPPNFAAPLVIAQHLDPNRNSQLEPILQRFTHLPAQTITDKIKLVSGTIYITPANRHVIIEDGHINLDTDHQTRPRPSIDLLFSSAAGAYGENVIAVILSGAGHDGAEGATEVKNHGGTVIVQNPATARYPSMPLSPAFIDSRVDIHDIGPLLVKLLAGEKTTQALSTDNNREVLQEILSQVNSQANFDFRSYKTSTILRRINRRMIVNNQATLDDYQNFLKTHSEEIGELVQAFLINVTQFFRDEEAFDYLRTEVLPKLIERGREQNRVLRFWSAGCSTGEEPYSLAMLIITLLGQEWPEWSIKIFATDLDEVAINFARQGIYQESALKGLPDEYRERFFEPTGQGYRINKILRQMVIFGQQDLTRNPAFPRIDLVVCRNVLIYFTLELQNYVLNQFAFSLVSGGYLFLGKAETIRSTYNQFELVNKQWKIYRCTSTMRPFLPILPRVEVPPSGQKQASMRQLEIIAPAFNLSNPQMGFEQLRALTEQLLRFLPIGLVIINRSYQVISANVTARRLLGLREALVEIDFLHSVRGIPYTQIRGAIDSSFRDQNTVTLKEMELDQTSGGNGRFLSVTISPLAGELAPLEMVVITVADVTEQISSQRQLEGARSEQTRLLNELNDANQRLTDLNKELADSNEELQVSNEELVLTHEELQASVEEYETTNEELQATNEELETNNEELQATNEELTTTNEELQTRTAQMQDQISRLDLRQEELNEALDQAPFLYLEVEGIDLLIKAYNDPFARLVQPRQRIIQEVPLREVLQGMLNQPEILVEEALRLYQQGTERVLPPLQLTGPAGKRSKSDQTVIFSLVPVRSSDGKIQKINVFGKLNG